MGNESIRSGSASTIGTKAWYIIGHVLQGHGDLGLGISNTDNDIHKKEDNEFKKAKMICK